MYLYDIRLYRDVKKTMQVAFNPSCMKKLLALLMLAFASASIAKDVKVEISDDTLITSLTNKCYDFSNWIKQTSDKEVLKARLHALKESGKITVEQFEATCIALKNYVVDKVS